MIVVNAVWLFICLFWLFLDVTVVACLVAGWVWCLCCITVFWVLVVGGCVFGLFGFGSWFGCFVIVRLVVGYC